jgi:hypothetical protein
MHYDLNEKQKSKQECDQSQGDNGEGKEMME